ncbi:MAG: hypothetical protein M3Y71_05620 [Actinomycetota bacterium]|nr:hypothetical protein [Actinomycetota bacterium]
MPLPSFSSPAPSRFARRALAVAAAVTGLAAYAVAPAQAATDTPDTTTSALVTRLTVDGGQGWVTVQVRVGAGKVVGFEVRVPADQGTWSGPADIAVRELGIHCRFVGTGDLHYTCGDTSDTRGDAPYLPSGGYQVTLPVTRTGALPVSGSLGHTWVDALDGAGHVSRYGFDSFPVVGGSHFFSTAEVRTAPMVADPGSSLSGVATVPVSMTVVPGEQVAAVDVTLPGSATWSLLGSNALPQGVSCSVHPATTGVKTLHCVGSNGAPLPAGRYQLVSTLGFTGPNVDGRTTRVALTMVGGTAEQVDTCHFRLPATL